MAHQSADLGARLISLFAIGAQAKTLRRLLQTLPSDLQSAGEVLNVEPIL